MSLPLRWRTSACRSCCRCSNTPCHTCTRSLSSTRRSWRAVTLTLASRPCLWMKPTCKCLLMLPWAFSGKDEVVHDLVQVKPSWILSYFQLFLCLSAQTCCTAPWLSTRLHWLAAVSLRLWLSSFLAVSSPGCHGRSEKLNNSLERCLPSFLIGGGTSRHTSALIMSAFSCNNLFRTQIILSLLISSSIILPKSDVCH